MRGKEVVGAGSCGNCSGWGGGGGRSAVVVRTIRHEIFCFFLAFLLVVLQFWFFLPFFSLARGYDVEVTGDLRWWLVA